jgi:hypothetical protein
LIGDKDDQIQQQFTLQIQAFEAAELNVRQEIERQIGLLG